MPREGTKTGRQVNIRASLVAIEIRYAPGGDENSIIVIKHDSNKIIEIRYAPGGDENENTSAAFNRLSKIEIRYAPGGDENECNRLYCHFRIIEIRYAPGGDENTLSQISNSAVRLLRLGMPREGTKTRGHVWFACGYHN